MRPKTKWDGDSRDIFNEWAGTRTIGGIERKDLWSMLQTISNDKMLQTISNDFKRCFEALEDFQISAALFRSHTGYSGSQLLRGLEFSA